MIFNQTSPNWPSYAARKVGPYVLCVFGIRRVMRYEFIQKKIFSNRMVVDIFSSLRSFLGVFRIQANDTTSYTFSQSLNILCRGKGLHKILCKRWELDWWHGTILCRFRNASTSFGSICMNSCGACSPEQEVSAHKRRCECECVVTVPNTGAKNLL